MSARNCIGKMLFIFLFASTQPFIFCRVDDPMTSSDGVKVGIGYRHCRLIVSTADPALLVAAL